LKLHRTRVPIYEKRAIFPLSPKSTSKSPVKNIAVKLNGWEGKAGGQSPACCNSTKSNPRGSYHSVKNNNLATKSLFKTSSVQVQQFNHCEGQTDPDFLHVKRLSAASV